MSRAGRGLACIAVLAGFCAMTAVPAIADSEGNIYLTITGGEQTHFSGECVVLFDDGKKGAVPLDGTVPLAGLLRGRRLSCQLQQDSEQGFLQIEMRKGGNVSRSRTQGKGSTINMRIG